MTGLDWIRVGSAQAPWKRAEGLCNGRRFPAPLLKRAVAQGIRIATATSRVIQTTDRTID